MGSLSLLAAYSLGFERATAAVAIQFRGAEIVTLNAIVRADTTRVIYEDSLRPVERQAQQPKARARSCRNGAGLA